MRLSKKLRQQSLKEALQADSFLNDEDLARRYNVSIQTIRLDRMELGIPELRERIRHMAQQQVRALQPEEVIGRVIELNLDESGISVLKIQKEHVFSRNGIARGHHLFAQANSLAVAIIDAKVVLTASANIRFIRSVRLGDECVAKAKIVQRSSHRLRVEVETCVEEETVFRGTFIMVRYEGDGEEGKEKPDADRV